ncbi:hypothetical protein ABW19_dt0207793 [Dactylella cylindrospora]|nr:hypothetical protein ABW19_dt0207793 [Dactylella cylindrospora]
MANQLPPQYLLLFLSILFQLALFSSASPAPFPYPELKLFNRQESDAICGAGSARCTNPLVSNFCCPTGTECIAVLDNTAVGCCPTGQDCRIIAPSDCGSTQAVVGDSAQLTQCSSGTSKGKCCPPGYICDGAYCQLQFESWPQSLGGPAPTEVPTAGTPVPSDGGNATSLSAAQRDAGFISKSECPPVTIGGFAAGFLPGLALGAALTYLIVCARRRRKENLAKHFSRMPSVNNRSTKRKGSKRGAVSGSEKSASKHDLMIGYNPNDNVTAPPEVFNGLGVSNVIAGRNYAVSNTSTQMFSQYEEPSDPARRGRLRVHGETPPLPSVALNRLGSAALASPQHQSSDYLPQTETGHETSTSLPLPDQSQSKSKKDKHHRRKNSNPSFKDLNNTSRFKFRNLLSHENLRETRGSMGSETSVGSSIHSSIFTSSERQSRGMRYPIALQPGSARSKGSSQNTPMALKQEIPVAAIRRADTNASDNTNIEDDYTPITPSNPKAFVNSSAPIPPAAPVSQAPPQIDIPLPSHTLRPQLTSPELHERYLNIPRPINTDRTSVASVAMTEMTEIDGYKSPFHDRYQYQSYTSEGSETDGYETDDGRSLAANSTYPSSFLDIHFDASSPVSPIDSRKSGYGSKALREVPSIPAIPPLFLNKNQPLDIKAGESSGSKSKVSPTKHQSNATSELDRESCDITVVIDDGLGAGSPGWRNNLSNVSSRGTPLGIGGAMTGGRYTMQTMEINKF